MEVDEAYGGGGKAVIDTQWHGRLVDEQEGGEREDGTAGMVKEQNLNGL